MRNAKEKDGSRRFTLYEFLTPQEVQFFSRMAAKLRNRHTEVLEEDTTAAEDQAAFSSTRADILEKCQLTHPIVYHSFNLCALYTSNGFKKLSVNLLRLICDREYFDLNISNIAKSRKRPT